MAVVVSANDATAEIICANLYADGKPARLTIKNRNLKPKQQITFKAGILITNL